MGITETISTIMYMLNHRENKKCYTRILFSRIQKCLKCIFSFLLKKHLRCVWVCVCVCKKREIKLPVNIGPGTVIVTSGNETIKCTVLRRDKMQLAKKLLWSQWHFQKIIIQYTSEDVIDSLIQFWWDVVHILWVKQCMSR